jgi:DNA polymerase I
METKCFNCEEYTDLQDVLDSFGVPYCQNCGCLFYGFEDHYRTCQNQKCQTSFMACYLHCPACGTFQRPLSTNGAPSRQNGSEKQVYTSTWHNYTINGGTSSMEFSFEVISDSRRLQAVVDELSPHSVISVDTETTGLDPFKDEVLLVQVATTEKVYIVDCSLVDIQLLKSVLENPHTLKILQNAKFDYKFIKQRFDISLNNIFDTMLAERVLTAGLMYRYSLEAMAKRYFTFDLDKTIRLSFTQGVTRFSEEQLRYAARDVVILFPLFEAQEKTLEQENLRHVAQLEFDSVIPIAEMELAGLKIDVEKWNTIINGHAKKRDELEVEALELLKVVQSDNSLFGAVKGNGFNLNSQKQVIERFAKFRIRIEDTSEATLQKVNHPAAKKLLEYREHDKIVTSFGEKFLALIHPATGRIHPDFQQLGTDTGRLSCQNPNVQQIPGEFRGCFIAEPGYKVITCDYSQAELRILAQLSLDPAFCKAFNSGGDLHAITASQMFKIPLESVSKTQRSQAKAINFGLAYGRGPASLAVQIGASEEEAKALIQQYFKAYSKVAGWLERAAKEAVEYGYSKTPIGRKRFYEIPNDSDPEYRQKLGSIQRQGKNTPIQGANADMTKYALIFIHEKLKGYDARLVNTVHDEIVVEAREDQAEEVLKIVEAQMIRAAKLMVTAVPIVADAILANTWSK